MKVVAIAQARMGSSRVPGKVLRPLMSDPVLAWTLIALNKVRSVDTIVLATSTSPEDDAIEKWYSEHGLGISNRLVLFRGSENDVLSRFHGAVNKYPGDIILRLTCDCPFLDPQVIEEVIQLLRMEHADYASNVDPPTWPDGLDVEAFTREALDIAHVEATRETDRECVTQYISRNRSRFKVVNLRCPLPRLAKERWVLDTEEDWKFCNELAKYVMPGSSYTTILHRLEERPEIRSHNASGVRNERFYDHLASEVLEPRSFEGSVKRLEKTTPLIPFGAQTFSKSYLQFPAGRAPLYCTHADGARIFDVDGNDYVDLVGAILPVVLGYRDPDVDEAIRRQLDAGISFSLATPLEYELASTLKRLIPCADMVKFGKSGTDVTTAAVRLARAFTGRDNVLLSGYHGWADWSMARTDRNAGIPLIVRENSHRIRYGMMGDIWRAWNTLRENVACIIVEPNEDRAYLEEVRSFCDQNGVILIFDEVITGFRYSMGGAQEHFGVTPDLACFGKAMGNGMPISALVGRDWIMQRMQPPNNIFYSGTMFGEALSLAASIATIRKMERLGVCNHLWRMGHAMRHAVCAERDKLGLTDVIKFGRKNPRVTLEFSDQKSATADQIRTLFLSEMAQGGVLIINSHNISWSHREAELKRVVTAYQRAFSAIKDAIEKGDIEKRIGNSIVTAAPLRATT